MLYDELCQSLFLKVWEIGIVFLVHVVFLSLILCLLCSVNTCCLVCSDCLLRIMLLNVVFTACQLVGIVSFFKAAPVYFVEFIQFAFLQLICECLC